MVTPDEAREIVLQQCPALPSQTRAHDEIFGCTLARDIVADVELPPFDNSAMDGYAVIAADFENESEVTLRVLETIAAGVMPTETVVRGTCSQIMTGAPIPAGCDAVVMREETERVDETTVRFTARVQRGQNIRLAGSDVRRGETVLRAGTIIRAAEWGMLASLNQAEVEVFGLPRVAVVTTGDEVVAPGAEIKPGQIRDSNSFTIAGLLRACGAETASQLKSGDSDDTLRAALQQCLQTCDAIITSGGVSAGDFDPVRDVLPQVGEVHFYKIAMKPGKPVMFATMQHDGRTVPVFGLPGNPVSVMVAFEQFVRPALLQMQGRSATQRVALRVAVQSSHRSPVGKVEYVRAKVQPNSATPAGWTADIAGNQGSGRLSSMTSANALLVIPADVTQLCAGDVVTAQMTDWPEI